MLTKAPKGTRDMLPKEAYKWHYIERKFADLCSRYNFLEMRTPVFEHTSLFVRGVGDTTDIVQKEMYTWEQGKRSLTLRPEGINCMPNHCHKRYITMRLVSDTKNPNRGD